MWLPFADAVESVIPKDRFTICSAISSGTALRWARPEPVAAMRSCGWRHSALRKAGWRIWCLAADMTVHDAAMYHLTQWWRRTVRVGYGYAMFMRLDSVRHDKQWIDRYRRSWRWCLGVPALTAVLALAFGWPALWLLTLYPLQVARLARRGRRSARENWSRAVALVLGYFAELHGQLKFYLQRYRGVRS